MKKILHSLRGTMERWFHESAEIAYSGCQNAEKLVTRSLVYAEN